MHYSMIEPPCSKFRVITAFVLGVWTFKSFTVDPDRTHCSSFRSSLIWVYTLYADLSIQKLSMVSLTCPFLLCFLYYVNLWLPCNVCKLYKCKCLVRNFEFTSNLPQEYLQTFSQIILINSYLKEFNSFVSLIRYLQSCTCEGSISLGGDWGEKVSLICFTSPCFELRDKFKYIEHIGESWIWTKTSPCLSLNVSPSESSRLSPACIWKWKFEHKS